MARGFNIMGFALNSRKTAVLALTIFLASASIGVLSVAYGAPLVAYAVVLVLVLSLFKYPEVFLTLFVFAGIFKSHTALSLPFNLDWTAAMGIAAIFAMILKAGVIGRKIRITVTKTDFFIVGLVLVLGFGLMYSRDPEYGTERVLELLFLGALASYFFPRITAGFSSSVKMVRNIFVTIVAVAGITVLATFFGMATGNRAFAGSYLSWSYFLGVAILSGLALFNISSNRLLRLGIIMLEDLFLVSMILAKARGPLISLVIVGIIVLFWRRSMPLSKKIGVLLTFLAVFAILLGVLPQGFWSRYRLLFSEEKGSSIEARLDAYKFAGHLFLKNPFAGAGTGSFRPLYQSSEAGYSLSYAHNAFLELASENGLLGLFFYMGFLISLLVFTRSILKDAGTVKIVKDLTYGCLLVFVFLLVGAQFSGAIIGRNQLFFAGLLVLMRWEGK